MQRTGWLIVALLAVSQTPPGVQQWYFSDNVLVFPTANWTVTGSLSGGGTGLSGTGRAISTVPPPYGPEYVVDTPLGGYLPAIWEHYLRMSPDQTSYYQVKLAMDTYDCIIDDLPARCPTGTVEIFRVQSGVWTSLGAVSGLSAVPARMKSWVTSGGASPGVGVALSYASGPATYLSTADTTLASGQPGLGLGGGIGRFPSVQFGSVDVTPPTAVNPASVGIGRFAYHLDVQWTASTDTGSGVLGYHLYRNSTYVGFTAETTYTIGALTPATTYTIGIEAEDCAGNRSTRTNVATSTSNAPPTPPGTYPGLSSPRQVGVRATGSYWGAGGESIDMLSGNLHYGFPLVQAGGRGGRSAVLKLRGAG